MSEAIENARKQFDSETTDHRMTVVHDDGVHRHLRFAAPGTGIWHWDIVTWPGHLAITGDIGDGWIFEREHDMLSFFARNGHERGINPTYWSEKMPSHLVRASKHFSADKFEAAVRADVASMERLSDEQRAGLLTTLESEVFGGYDDINWSLEAISGEWNVPPGLTVEFTDMEHGDYDEWDHHFLLALFAIVFAVRAYREYEAAIEAARAPIAA